MTTAKEIELKMAEAMPRIAALSKGLEATFRDLAIYGMHVAIARDVCARRARKLRKRGEDVRYFGKTTTGKARYRWIRRIEPLSIYKPAPN